MDFLLNLQKYELFIQPQHIVYIQNHHIPIGSMYRFKLTKIYYLNMKSAVGEKVIVFSYVINKQ